MSKTSEARMDKSKDHTRPSFNRMEGEFGIYFDVMDVEMKDKKSYGSRQFMLTTATEKLQEYFLSDEIDVGDIKKHSEKKRLLKRIVIDGFQKGSILVCTCDNIAAVETVWKQYNAGDISKFFRGYFESRPTLEYLEATKLELRVRMWKDEYESCKMDFLANKIMQMNVTEKPSDLQMLKKARSFQLSFTKELYKLRDDEYDLESHFGEFINLAKTHLPEDVQIFKTMDDVNKLLQRAKDRKADKAAKLIQQYGKTVDKVRDCAQKLQECLYVPLAQVHAACETEKEQKTKVQICEVLDDVLRMTEPEYDFSGVRHKNWEGKMLHYEHKMFQGLVCYFPCVIDKTVDVDHLADDYFDELKIDLDAHIH